MSSLIGGVLWNLGSNIAIRASAFAAQVVLGSVLSRDDFAVYGIALSLSALVSALSNGGTQQILVQRWREYDALAPYIAYIAFAFNIASGALLLLIGWWWSTTHALAHLQPTLAIMVAASLLITPALIMKTKLAIDSRFRAASLVSAIAGLGRSTAAIVLGLTGLGIYSFTLPAIAEAAIALLLTYVYVRAIPRPKRPDRHQFTAILRDTRWQMVSTFAAAMSLYGQFMLVGLFLEKAELGTFVFAMQLIQSATVLIVVVISDVIYPRLTQFIQSRGDDATLLRAFEICLLVSLSVATMATLSSGPILSFVWGQKWHDAIPVVQILTVFIFTTAGSFLLSSVQAARGSWRNRTLLQIACVIGDVIAVVIAGRSGNLMEICAAVVAMRLALTFAATCFVLGNGTATRVAQIAATHWFVLPYLALLLWQYSPTAALTTPSETTVLAAGSALLLALGYRIWMQMKRTDFGIAIDRSTPTGQPLTDARGLE